MKSQSLAERHGWAKYVAHQVYYSLLDRDYEWELLPLAQDQGIGAMVWSPLAMGQLTGKIRHGQAPQPGTRAHDLAGGASTDQDQRLFAIIAALDSLVEETGRTIPQIALNWLLRQPSVANVIIGARNVQQLVANIGAVGWSLTTEQVARLAVASDVRPSYPTAHQRRFAMLDERSSANN